MKPSSYILELTVFTGGAVIMIFELVGSRVLGPYFGTSIFVWTSLIGIILGSLSLGYHLGGKVSDTNPTLKRLASIIFLAGLLIGIMMLCKDPLLVILQKHISDVRISSVIATIVLFSPPSVLLGMISPYAAKLKLQNLNTAGSTIGNLYAISTTGSIVGTFLSGFYLIPLFGTNALLMSLSVTMMLLATVLYVKQIKSIGICAIAVLLVGWAAIHNVQNAAAKNGVIDIDTAYSRIWIYDLMHPRLNTMIKIMGINNENHSSMFLESDELVNEYSKFFHLARHFHPGFSKTAMFGGAGYSFPRDFLAVYPEATMDVVEIDPKVTELAKTYFRLKDDPRLSIYHQDGRVFLNTTQHTYDVIFGDAFGSRYSVPYQLTTQEAVQKKYDILADDGVVILNMISAIEGKQGQFFRAEYATYKSVFPQVYAFPVWKPGDAEWVQNVILVALKSKEAPSFRSIDSTLNAYLEHVWKPEITTDLPVITDDYAPVEHYASKTI